MDILKINLERVPESNWLDGFAIRYITALLTRLKLERETRLELATLTFGKVMLYQLSYSCFNDMLP